MEVALGFEPRKAEYKSAVLPIKTMRPYKGGKGRSPSNDDLHTYSYQLSYNTKRPLVVTNAKNSFL